MTLTRTVIAAAGRRIDDDRFPERNEGEVARAIRGVVDASRPSLILASAACGADILVLEAARDLGIPTQIVLPFSAPAFRERSVGDCIGNWARRYDELIAGRVPGDGSLLLMTTEDPVSDEQANGAYRRVTDVLIEEVVRIVRHEESASGGALLVWDGVRRDQNDESGYFLDRARAQGWQVIEISTRPST